MDRHYYSRDVTRRQLYNRFPLSHALFIEIHSGCVHSDRLGDITCTWTFGSLLLISTRISHRSRNIDSSGGVIMQRYAWSSACSCCFCLYHRANETCHYFPLHKLQEYLSQDLVYQWWMFVGMGVGFCQKSEVGLFPVTDTHFQMEHLQRNLVDLCCPHECPYLHQRPTL